MKRRRNPSNEHPFPSDPYGDDEIGPVLLAIENTRDLFLAEQATLVKLAKQAVEGKYTEGKAVGAWESLARKGLRQYHREGGERLSESAIWSTATWLTAWGEHQLFGRGLHHLLKLSQGDLSDV
jgi:hypothetical protein